MQFLFSLLADIDGPAPAKKEQVYFSIEHATHRFMLTHNKGTQIYQFHNKVFFDAALEFIQTEQYQYIEYRWNASLKEHPAVAALISQDPKQWGWGLWHLDRMYTFDKWHTLFENLYRQYTIFQNPPALIDELKAQYLRRLQKKSSIHAFYNVLRHNFDEQSRLALIDYCLSYSPELLKHEQIYNEHPNYRYLLKEVHCVFDDALKILRSSMWKECGSFECTKEVNFVSLFHNMKASEFQTLFTKSFTYAHIKNKNNLWMLHYIRDLDDATFHLWWNHQTERQQYQWMHYCVERRHDTLIERLNSIEPEKMIFISELHEQYHSMKMFSPLIASKAFKQYRYHINHYKQHETSPDECSLYV